MDPDLLIVGGVILILLAFPALLQSFTHERTLRTPAILLAAGIGFIGFAISRNPSGYTVDNIPEVFVRVFANYLS